jgi:amino acid transporter
MSLDYVERRAKGQRKRKEYLRRISHAEDLSRMFSGIAVGFGFMFVMGIVSNAANRLIEIVFLIGCALVIYFSVFFSQYVMFKAEQSRYPKSRRHTLWSAITEK